MANVKRERKYPMFVSKLRTALRSDLLNAGIPATISHEPVPTTKLYRIYVTSPKFSKMRPSERQDLVWRIAKSVLTDDEQLLISMILTVSPDELAPRKAV